MARIFDLEQVAEEEQRRIVELESLVQTRQTEILKLQLAQVAQNSAANTNQLQIALLEKEQRLPDVIAFAGDRDSVRSFLTALRVLHELSHLV